MQGCEWIFVRQEPEAIYGRRGKGRLLDIPRDTQEALGVQAGLDDHPANQKPNYACGTS